MIGFGLFILWFVVTIFTCILTVTSKNRHEKVFYLILSVLSFLNTVTHVYTIGV